MVGNLKTQMILTFILTQKKRYDKRYLPKKLEGGHTWGFEDLYIFTNNLKILGGER